MSTSAKLHDLREGASAPKEDWPDVTNLVTEDDTPVDNIYAEKQQRLLTESLYSSWNPGEPFVAMANVGVFYKKHEPPLVPDVLYAAGVSAPADPFPKEHRSYFLWLYGKPPDAVIESVSNREGGEDTHKMKIYAAIGVSYYVIWDAQRRLSKERLRIYLLHEGMYVPMPGTLFKRLGLGVTIWHGAYEDLESDWLRWCDAQGSLILTGAERADVEGKRADSAKERAEQEKQRAEQEKQRAEQEKQRAEQEKQRAETADARAERLAAKLRALGVDPNGGQ